MTKIDVLLPFHRLDEYLTEAIRSVLDSTGVSINLILLDNRKGERSELDLEIFSRIQEQSAHSIQLVSVLEPLTYPNALNTGLNYCDNEFIALMNSDDLISPERFFLQTKGLKENDGDISICKLIKFDGNKELSSVSGFLNLEHYSWTYLLLGAYGADASLTFKKSWIAIGDKSFPETQHSDWLFAIRNYPTAKIVAMEKPLYFYRIHSRQITKASVNFKVEAPLADELFASLESLGVKIEDFAILSALAAPFLRVKLGRKQFSELQSVCSLFLRNFENLDQKANVRKILARRIIFSVKNPLQIFGIDKEWRAVILKEIMQLFKLYLCQETSIRSFNSGK